MATECIGDLNHKQPHVRIMDPYSSGVNSGRRAAPDAQSAAQNTEAHARAAAAANGMEPTLSQPWKNGCKRVCTPAPSAPPPSSGHLAWYPIPTTYPPDMYSPTMYTAQYPIYWPVGHFHTPHV